MDTYEENNLIFQNNGPHTPILLGRKGETIPKSKRYRDEPRHRKWVFTCNNYTENDRTGLISAERLIKYCVWGYEVAPTTGTNHYQGFVEWKNARAFSTIQKEHPRFRWEPAKGSVEDNFDYCTKEGQYEEIGKRPEFRKNQGKRNDLSHIKERIFAGDHILNIIKDDVINYQQLRFTEGLTRYIKPRKRDVTIKWYYGSTGSGKTYNALNEFGDNDYWISGKNLKWWEGYYGQEYVLIDDYRRDFCTFHELLRILDKYPYRVEYKGSSTWLNAKVIIITCPYRPEQLYMHRTSEDVQQLLRRIDEIKLFGEEVYNKDDLDDIKEYLKIDV